MRKLFRFFLAGAHRPDQGPEKEKTGPARQVYQHVPGGAGAAGDKGLVELVQPGQEGAEGQGGRPPEGGAG